MRKAKTNKSIASRVKVTGGKKLKSRHPGRRHILTKKTSKRKRSLAKPFIISEAHEKRYKQLIQA